MKCMCESAKGYALCDPVAKRAYRFSFSRSLLEFIKETEAPHLQVCRVFYELGIESDPPLYAVVKKKNNFILRITPLKAMAERWKNEHNLILPVSISKVVRLAM